MMFCQIVPFERTLNTRAVYLLEEFVRTLVIGMFFQYQDVFVTSGKASIFVRMCASLPSITWYLISCCGQLVMEAKGLSGNKMPQISKGYIWKGIGLFGKWLFPLNPLSASVRLSLRILLRKEILHLLAEGSEFLRIHQGTLRPLIHLLSISSLAGVEPYRWRRRRRTLWPDRPFRSLSSKLCRCNSSRDRVASTVQPLRSARWRHATRSPEITYQWID